MNPAAEKFIKNFQKSLPPLILSAINISTSPAHAADVCQRNTDWGSSTWVMLPSGNDFQNGQVIGSTRSSVTYYLPSSRTTVIVDGRSSNITQNQYNVVDLPKTPGVGVRIKWGGHWVHGSYKFNILNSTSNGTLLSRNSEQNLIRGNAPYSYIITLYYDYEIIVTDSKKYKGGKLIVDTDAKVLAITSHSAGYGQPIPCIGGTLDLLDTLKGDVTIPELPDPPTPTCASADLTLAAKMNSVTSSQTAGYGTSRSNGALSEFNFTLAGRRCPQGTTIKAYFTDSKYQSEERDYLKSSHPDVGLRIYHRQEEKPIQFGPAPLGSTLPLRPAIIEGPTTSTMTDILVPFTAQYVRTPTASAGSIRPGSLKAAATVTFMYD